MANPAIVVGSGPHRVVALHGWFGSARGWGSLPDYLDPDAFSYAFMDLRGYGEAKDRGGPYGADDVASDAIELADSLGWRQFSLLGHSMGGMFAQRVAVRAPERVRCLVGLNPVPASGVPFDEAGWALFEGAATDPAKRAAIIDYTTGNRLTRTFVDRVVRHSLEHSSVEAFAAYLTTWARTDFSAEVRGLPTPVKVVVGEHDPAISAQVMRDTFLAFYPNAELEVLANAGHYPMFETPVALATSIERFLREAPEPA
jgi:pimeloyl-ACP methyl ester carboxylesterase